MPFEGIGAAVRRKEDARFLSGRGNYTDDINRPGQLYAFIRRSDRPHAKIGRIDTGAAATATVNTKNARTMGAGNGFMAAP